MDRVPPIDGTELMRAFVPESPFVAHTGIEIEALSEGEARLRLPFRDELVTIGSVVHGGAIATLIDTAAMAAAWSGAAVPDSPRGSTVALSLNYLAPADGEDVIATASVARRGRRLTNLRVDVQTASGTPAATAIATYQIG